MNSSLHIIDELKEISPLLATIEKTNIFSVPEGYFINLNEEVLDRINSESSFIFSTSGNHILQVPEGYFENLTGNILQKIKNKEVDNAANELKELSPMLYAVQNEKVFTVPEGYFENFGGNILQKIKNTEFEIAADELKELSPMLYAVQNENVFTVPPGYFKNLVNEMVSKVTPQQQTKVVAMRKRTYWNYAVAAMMTGIIALSSLWILNKPSEQPLVGQKTETAFIPSSSVQASFNYKNEQQIEEGISTLSADDIVKYLEVTDRDIDNEDLTTSIGDNELPAQEDYLLDEKTLDNYLNQLDSKVSEN